MYILQYNITFARDSFSSIAWPMQSWSLVPEEGLLAVTMAELSNVDHPVYMYIYEALYFWLALDYSHSSS